MPAAPEADELQQPPLELPRYLLVAVRESGGHRAYALLPPYAAPSPFPAPLAGRRHGCPGPVLVGFTRIYTYAESGWNAAVERSAK